MCLGRLNTWVSWFLWWRRFSWWETKEKWMLRIRAHPPPACQDRRVVPRMSDVRTLVQDLTSTSHLYISHFTPSSNFLCLFLYCNIPINTCSLQMAPLRQWRLGLTSKLWPVAEWPYFHGRCAPLVPQSDFTSSHKQQEGSHTSAFFLSLNKFGTVSRGVKSWVMSKVNFFVGLEPVRVFPACTRHRWSETVLASLGLLCWPGT